MRQRRWRAQDNEGRNGRTGKERKGGGKESKGGEKGESPEYQREQDIHKKRKTENPPLYKKEEAVFASSFLFIATMSRL